MIDGTRRRLVKAVGGIATVGLLAGCTEDDEDGEEEEGEDDD